MATRDIVVIGASAGGIQPLLDIVATLPAALPAAVFVVVHTPPYAEMTLARLLGRRSALRGETASDGMAIERGVIYVAPPDHHLTLRPTQMRVTRGPKENGTRPAVDPLFRSAADVFGPRVIAITLSGALDDGTAGLRAVCAKGGYSIVQDPDEALHPSMPESAVAAARVDLVLPAIEIGPALIRLVGDHVELNGADKKDPEVDREILVIEGGQEAMQRSERPGIPSGFGCPECGGALWEIGDGPLIRFRCRTGHGYSSETLLAEQNEAVEGAMWIALRALEERAALSERIALRARQNGRASSAESFIETSKTARAKAEVIRRALVQTGSFAP